MKLALSVGHSEAIRGMRGQPVPPECDEVDTCLILTQDVSALLEANGVEAPWFFDTEAQSQSEYLANQAQWTSDQNADLGVQFHLNAGGGNGPVGCEVWYYSAKKMATKVATAMADALGLPDRGPKWTESLSWIMNSDPPCVLLECFFGDSTHDCEAYRAAGKHEALVNAIAEALSGLELDDPAPERPPIEPDRPPTETNNYVQMTTAAQPGVQVLINGLTIHGRYVPGQPVVDITLRGHGDCSMEINGEMFHNKPPEEPAYLFEQTGRCSWFGGPDDSGVSPSEGLAFIYSYDERPDLFLPQQPPGTTGLARRLNPDVFYLACRWDYSVTPKELLKRRDLMARVSANGRSILCWPADWGPNENTGRIVDLSPAALEALELTTDDGGVTVAYPVEPEVA